MSPKPWGWAAGPRCPHPSTLSTRLSPLHPLTSPFHVHQPLQPSVCPSSYPFSLPSPPSSPPHRPSSFSRCARLQPSCPCRRSRPGRPSPWPGRPSPWHLGCGIPGAGICRGGGAGAAGAGRWERPREVQDGRQGMSIVHHRSRPGLTAPLGFGGGGGPGRAPRLLGLGQRGGQDRPLAPHPCVGSGCSQRKAMVKVGRSFAAGRCPVGTGIPLGWASPWGGHPSRTGIPLGWAFHQSEHPTGMGIPLGWASPQGGHPPRTGIPPG